MPCGGHWARRTEMGSSEGQSGHGHGGSDDGQDGRRRDGLGSDRPGWDERLGAYSVGRADGMAGRRDAARAEDSGLGRDYRIGFLDGRLEVFRMHAAIRKIVEET